MWRWLISLPLLCKDGSWCLGPHIKGSKTVLSWQLGADTFMPPPNQWRARISEHTSSITFSTTSITGIQVTILCLYVVMWTLSGGLIYVTIFTSITEAYVSAYLCFLSLYRIMVLRFIFIYERGTEGEWIVLWCQSFIALSQLKILCAFEYGNVYGEWV